MVDGSPIPGGRSHTLSYAGLVAAILFYSYVRLAHGDIPWLPLIPILIGGFAWLYDGRRRLIEAEDYWRDHSNGARRMSRMRMMFLLDAIFGVLWILWLADPYQILGHIYSMLWAPALVATIRLRFGR